MAVDAVTPARQMTRGSNERRAIEGRTKVHDDGTEGCDASIDRESEPVTTFTHRRRYSSPLLQAGVLGLVALLTLATVAAHLRVQSHEAQNAAADRALYLQVAKQAASNLTTIDYRSADGDVQRVLRSAMGPFHDEFARNVEPFVDAVKSSRSVTQGTVTEAGLESVTGAEAQAVVAVTVTSSTAGVQDPQSRSWRMRMTVQKDADVVKVSNVGFVS